MSDWLRPTELFNLLLLPAGAPLTRSEMLASPFGLAVFLPLIPLLRGLARWNRRAALLGCGLLWLVLTLGPRATLIFLAAVTVGAAWVLSLAAWHARGRISRGAMLAGVWIGLHALVLPAWWFPSADWYGWQPGRLAFLHNIGLAYFLLRFIAWGVELADHPDRPARLLDTACWILYPPCMRLGPVLRRETFLERLDAWEPRVRPAWGEGAARFGLFLLGVLGVGVTIQHMPPLAAGTADFFSFPQGFSTRALLTRFYLIPVQVYLLLWSYNELAAALSRWVGIRVDNNFDWLPTATSVRDFWRRWHATVGAWLRDYIYIPLGGNRRHVALNYALTFGYIGIWHGPSWSFPAWGLLQAAALIMQRQWDRWREGRPALPRAAQPVATIVCWLLTMHFAAATIIVFTDFHYLGTRFLPELVRRLVGT